VNSKSEPKNYEADDETNRDLHLTDQLRKFERELRLVEPINPMIGPDAMYRPALSTTQTERPVQVDGSPTVVITNSSPSDQTARTVKYESRWVAVIACSWFLGAIAGALAMWATTSREAVPTRATNVVENTDDTQSIQDIQNNVNSPQDLMPEVLSYA
jgi:hypothetical protein